MFEIEQFICIKVDLALNNKKKNNMQRNQTLKSLIILGKWFNISIWLIGVTIKVTMTQSWPWSDSQKWYSEFFRSWDSPPGSLVSHLGHSYT